NENSYVDTATVDWYIDSGFVATGQNTTYPLLSQIPGPKTLVSNATRPYYITGTDNISININGLVDVYWWEPLNGSSQAYPGSFEIKCLVKDNNSGVSVEGYSVDFWYLNGSDYVYNGTYTTNSSGLAGYIWYPDSKGILNFMCNITDNTTVFYSPNIGNATATIIVEDINAPSITNMTIIPNSTMEANLNATNITAIIIDDIGVYSAFAMITLPNGSIVNVTMVNTVNDTYSTLYMPPIGGNYSVDIVASDSPPENNTDVIYAGNFSVWGETGMTGEQTDSFAAFSITQTSGESFVLTVNATNNGPATAYNISISVDEIPVSTLTYNTTNYDCGNLSIGEMCTRDFLVTVPAKTGPQLITVYNTIWWDNPDRTMNSTVGSTIVVVASNPILEVIPDYIQNQTPHGETTLVDTVTVSASGNDDITNILLDIVGDTLEIDCPLCNLTISQPSWGYLPAGSNFTSDISIDIPYGQDAGYYWTWVSAESDNAAADSVLVNATVPLDVSWGRVPSTYGTILALVNTSTTQVGTIAASNNGNSERNVQVLLSGNGTSFVTREPLAFSLGIGASSNVTVNYSIPPSAAQDMYYVMVYLSDAEGNPPFYITDFWLNVTDLPPVISNVSIDPMGYESGTEYTNISAEVTDNVAVSHVWLNSTKPNGTVFIDYFAMNGTSVYLNYSENETGIHKIKICANDTASLVICTPEYNVTVAVNTTIITDTNITNATIYGVTLNSGLNITINFTTLNAGYSRALNVNTTITYPALWNVSPSQFDMGNIFKTPYNGNTQLSIPKDIIGDYYINFTSNWTNYDNSTDNLTTVVKVTIGSNPVLNISEDPVMFIIENGNNDSKNMTMESLGNDIAEDIEFNCTSGIGCTDFNISFNPSSIVNLTKGNSTNFTITAYVPETYSSGIYYMTYTISTSKTNTYANITVVVPENMTWMHNPVQISKIVIANTTGEFGSVRVSNIGNMNLTVSAESTNTTLFGVNASTLNLSIGNYSDVMINYTAPGLTSLQTYTAYFRTTNLTAFPQYHDTLLNITIHPLYLDVISPTSSSPVLNVSKDDNMTVIFNLTYALAPLDDNVTWQINLTGAGTSVSVNITYVNYSVASGLWTVNFTAPDIISGVAYDLVANAFYATDNLLITATEQDAIIYTDATPPQLSVSLPA
ncbi:MAG: hypothetical protein KAR23_01330, partial [Candidatus Aenigmarchaeota archaeon]|nr:hypothetical protein [Candidatus Aenigmarchaeota archaeon]